MRSSDPTPLRRTAAVVRDRGDVDDVGDLVADRIERADGRLATRAGALDADLEGLQTVFLRRAPGLLRRDLRRERSGLARATKTGAPGGRPRQGVALAIRDRDDGVVERSLHVADTVGDDALVLLLRLRSGCGGGGL